MLCDWLQRQGHHCDTALLADMPQAHEEVARFILQHRPDVVIYDVGMPYASSWDLLEVIRASSPALQSQPFVITTPNKRKLASRGANVRRRNWRTRGGLASSLKSGRSSEGCSVDEHVIRTQLVQKVQGTDRRQ
jgi:CheY-like chemotaxis protein